MVRSMQLPQPQQIGVTKSFVHLWVVRLGMRCCLCCGIVLSAAPGKRTSPCRGVVRIGLRNEMTNDG